MSHPAIYIAQTPAQPLVAFSRHGALSLAAEIYRHGPYRMFLNHGPYNCENIDGLTFAEAGMLLNPCLQSVLFFTTGDSIGPNPATRDALLALLSARWSAWRFNWARGGAMDLARALYLPSHEMYVDHEAPRCPGPDLMEQDVGDYGSLISLRTHGRTRHFFLANNVEEAVARGEQLIVHLLEKRDTSVPPEESTISGAAIDVDNKRIEIWWSQARSPDLLEWVQTRWRGWRVEEQTVGLNQQLRSLGITGDANVVTDEEAWRLLQDALRGYWLRGIDIAPEDFRKAAPLLTAMRHPPV